MTHIVALLGELYSNKNMDFSVHLFHLYGRILSCILDRNEPCILQFVLSLFPKENQC